MVIRNPKKNPFMLINSDKELPKELKILVILTIHKRSRCE